MRPYVHNPAVFRAHFAGRGLPAFQGARYQRGHGRIGKIVKKVGRAVIPLFKAGVGAVAPHVKGAVKTVATGAMQHAFPHSPAMQNWVGNTVGNIAGGVAGKISRSVGNKKRKKRKPAVRRKGKRRATTTKKNIFA